MAVNTGFLNNLTGKLGRFKTSLADALLGSANIQSTGGGKYPDGIQNYLDSLENQPYMQGLLNQPKQTGLSLDQYKQGIAQGLNFGVPEIADAQKKLKINIPQTAEEIEQAKTGTFNSYPLQAGLSGQERQGGILSDIASGYRDNYDNGFNPTNLAPQNKSIATKIGEGLGTFGRFIDSPLGRGLIAGGLTSALGYDNALQEALTAITGRQNAMIQDSAYRNSLMNQGIDLSGIRGNVTSDVYKNLSNDAYRTANLKAKKDIAEAKDNVSKARMIMSALNNGSITPQEAQLQMANYGITLNDVQESNNTKLLPYRQYAMQVAPQVALGNLGVAQGNLALRQAELPYDVAYKQAQIQNMLNKGTQDKKTQDNINSLNTIKGQLDRFSSTFGDVNNPYRYRIAGGVSQKLNTLTPAESNFNSQASLLLNKIARDLGGEKGVLSDQDIARIKESMPKLEDTTAQKNAKMNAIYDLLQDRMAQYGYTNNIQQSTQNAGGQTQTIGKYKVRVK